MASVPRNILSPTTLVVLLAFTLTLTCAHASTLGNGQSAPPSPLFPTGSVFATATGTITASSGTDNMSVSFTETVYKDPSNTWCHNCLDFVYVFNNIGPDVNERYSMSNFTGFSIDAGTTPFGIHDPTTIDRSGTGPNIGFNFPGSDEIVAGQTTVSLVIETNATNVTAGTVSAQDGVAGSSAVALAPASPTPEPGSLGLMGGGLLVIGGLLRRARTAVK